MPNKLKYTVVNLLPEEKINFDMKNVKSDTEEELLTETVLNRFTKFTDKKLFSLLTNSSDELDEKQGKNQEVILE